MPKVKADKPATEDPPFKMTLSLNVLNHLGINLYSNVPSVLAEVVANAWDADAENVEIEINKDKRHIVISDDGHGMSKGDINNKYLHVGYSRRTKAGEETTPKHVRRVMGRKGIGKLSLFSVADEVQVQSVKAGDKNGFLMSADDIKSALTSDEDSGQYFPTPVPAGELVVTEGTRITLTKLKKDIGHAEQSLRKRLARRFSIIGESHKFSIKINGTPIAITDRDYFHKIQYLWVFGANEDDYAAFCTNKSHSEPRSGVVEGVAGACVSGWIGTVKESSDLKDADDNLNKITVMTRGKLAQEDILEDFAEGGIYTKYLIGEIHADFLDTDNEQDIATSSRQKIMEDDVRYVALKSFLQKELKHVQNQWTNLRNQEGTDRALEVPGIKEWFNTLKRDAKEHAKSLFGKINQLTIENEAERRRLLKHSVLAFESLRYKDNLDALEKVSAKNLQALGEIFGNLNDIEATLYHQIVSERIAVIRALNEKVEENAKEKVVQAHLFKHLWLLDPGWERATDSEYMEEQVAKEFGKIDTGLSRDELAGRLDIKYMTTSKKHVIVELKRAERVVSTAELLSQIDKYRSGLTKILRKLGRAGEAIEVVCIVGKELSDWYDAAAREESRGILEKKNGRVVLFQELIENAFKAYNEFLKKNKEAGSLATLINSIETAELTAPAPAKTVPAEEPKAPDVIPAPVPTGKK